MQLQQDQLGLSLDSPSSAYSGTPRSALIQARKDVYAYKQRCSDLEMSLYVKEEALEHRDECLMYTREQLKSARLKSRVRIVNRERYSLSVPLRLHSRPLQIVFCILLAAYL